MDLYAYDDAVRSEGFAVITGIDEAGRGPLAGPVVAAAVTLLRGARIDGVRDSKQVPAKEREELFDEIIRNAADIGIGIVAPDEIDRINILEATKVAMKKAVMNLSGSPDILLIDALRIPSMEIRQKPIIKGDAKSASIAAASIIAKVVRDRIMDGYHVQYPHYGFDRHKGYATRAHLARIREYGPCPIHRKSFHKVKDITLPF